jgi:hypothetical protein
MHVYLSGCRDCLFMCAVLPVYFLPTADYGSRWERGAGRGNTGKDGEWGVGRETKGQVGRRQRDEGADGA